MVQMDNTFSTFDSSRKDDASILYDVFFLGERFTHQALTEESPLVLHEGKAVQLTENEDLLLNSVAWDGTYQQGCLAVRQGQLEVTFTNFPKQAFTLSSKKDAAIRLSSPILGFFEPSEYGLFVRLFASGGVLYLNGQRLMDYEGNLRLGDTLVCDGLVIEVRRHQLKIVSLLQSCHLNPRYLVAEAYQVEFPLDFPDYRRSPRIFLRAPEERVQVKAPKARKEKRRGEILRTVVPPLGMLVMTGAVSMISQRNPLLTLGMGGASLMTAGFSVANYRRTRKETDAENQTIVENYQNYLVEMTAKLEKLEADQRQSLTYNYPSIDDLVQMAQDFSPRIYEKMQAHEDFLYVRLGEGDVDTSYSLDLSEREQSDEWEQFTKTEIVEKRQVLTDAPVVISLKDQTLGLAGSSYDLQQASQSILFQIAMMHSYHDIEFVSLVSSEDYQSYWQDWRWLPHVTLKELNLRGLIHNEQTRDMVLNSFYQIVVKRAQMVREAGGRTDKLSFSPHYVLTILDDSYLTGHGLNEYLVEDMSQYGVTVIWGKENRSMLPETVTALVEYQNKEAARLINDKNEFVNRLFTPNKLHHDVIPSLQRLANLHHIEAEKNSIPESIGFLELYQVKDTTSLDVYKRWQLADTSKSLAVPLGLRGKDDVVYLNLHERAHGPHGLVAGTTGSGKSEILQSYILSLAVNFSPEDVGFLPIDFKGGGMANLFADLPHLMGSITNLDGASSARALKSIRAELQKRQREFGKYGVNHINGYTKLYKEGQREQDPIKKADFPSKPLPHLFLISDEFAELKQNEPEFMAELVSTARIGRSLGVHLILATQKPSGVVDDQIWSNSRFKLALKVANESDSKEIIKTPDAASIVQPGRAYLQVGNNEIYELFQSAWSGAQYDPDKSDEHVIDERIWLVNDLGQYELLSSDLSADEDYSQTSQEDKTELTAVIDEIAAVSANEAVTIPDKPWLPPLAEEILPPTIDWATSWKEPRTLSVPLGQLDIPEHQSQTPFVFSLEELSHFAIIGSAGFGKSVALQTFVMNLARMNSPEQVHVYLFDFGTNGLLPLKDLPHVADRVTIQDEEKLTKFLKRVRTDIQVRKDLFTELGVGSLSQYEAKTGSKLPIITLVLDAFDAIQESPLREAVEAVVALILREGANIGIYIAMTALRPSSFRLAIASTLPNRLALYLVDEIAAKEILGRDALLPQAIPGRGQIKQDDGVHEFQFYLPTAGATEMERLTALEKEAEEMSAAWTGSLPKPVPMLPKVVYLADFFKEEETKDMLQRLELPLAYDKETTNVLGFRPEKHGHFVIAEETAQQSDMLTQTVLEDFTRLDGQVTRVVFNAGGRFQGREEAYDVLVDEAEYASFLTELSTEIDEREAGGDRSPMFIYIPDAHLLNNHILTSLELFNKMLSKGPKVGIYIILQGIQRTFETAFDEFNKRIRMNVPAGIFGTRATDQKFVPIKPIYGEPIVALDEAHFFEARDIKPIKLNQ